MRSATPLLLLLLLGACSSGRVAGTGSQTGNSVVAGRLLRADSTTPDPYDTIVLKTASWTGDSASATPRATTTDDSGAFRFEDVPAGLWTVECAGRALGWKRTFRVSQGRDTTLPDAIPKAFGTLVVEIHLTDELKRASLLVLGRDTAYSLMTSAKEIFVTIRALPAGTHTLVVRKADGTFLQQAVAKVRPAAVDSLYFSAWSTRDTGPAEDEPDGDADDD